MRSRAPHQYQRAHALDAALDACLPSMPTSLVSIWYGDPDGRTRYARLADAEHYAASTMKLPLLVAAYRLHARGLLDLDRAVPVHNHFRSALDGSPYSLDQADDQDDDTWSHLGGSESLRVLVHRAITRSGNLATNLTLEHVGTTEMDAVLADAGCSPATTLPRGIGDAAARRAGLDNRVTAADLARVLGGVAARTLAATAVCAEVEAVLADQEYRDMIPAGLPEGVYVANKTGWVSGVAHDVALVRPDSAAPYVLVVCTSTRLPEDEAYRVVAAVSAVVWREHVR